MDDVVLQERMVDFRTVSERGLLASDLYRGSWILRVHAEVDVRAEAHAEDVRWHFDALDNWRSPPLRNTISNAGSVWIRETDTTPSRWLLGSNCQTSEAMR